MELEQANTAFEEARLITDFQVLKGVKVVGMTTSGAARLRKLLQMLAPSIGNFIYIGNFNTNITLIQP